MLATCSENKLFGIAVMTRLALVLLMILCDRLVPDYDSCSELQHMPLKQPRSTVASNKWIEHRQGAQALRNHTEHDLAHARTIGSLWRSPLMPFANHWDGIHFTHIGRFGYSHENLCAFFPFVPVFVLGQWGQFLESIVDPQPEFGTATTAPQDLPVWMWFVPSAAAFALLTSVLSFSASCVYLRRLTYVNEGTSFPKLAVWAERNLQSTSSGRKRRQTPQESTHLEWNETDLQQLSPSVMFVGTVMVFFLMTPAAAFTVVGYTESVFSFFCFTGMWLCARKPILVDESVPSSVEKTRSAHTAEVGAPGAYNAPIYRLSSPSVKQLVLASAAFCVATIVRSNGILLCGFLVYPILVSCKLVPFAKRLPVVSGRAAGRFARMGHTLLRQWGCGLCLLPYFVQNMYCHYRFCSAEGTVEQQQLYKPPAGVVGDKALNSKGLLPCPEKSLGMYGYIQLKYWGVGWFTYYTPNNIHNFGIAAPLYFFVLYALVQARPWRRGSMQLVASHEIGESTALALLKTICRNEHLAYLLAMMALAATRMHVQVVTRFVLSCPALYWLFAEIATAAWQPSDDDVEHNAQKQRMQALGGSSATAAAVFRDLAEPPCPLAQKRRHGKVATLLVVYVCMWSFLSCLLFSNFFPWT